MYFILMQIKPGWVKFQNTKELAFRQQTADSLLRA